MDILKNIRETALTHPKRYAVQSREQKLTYEELEEYSNRLAVWIAKNSQDRKRPVIVYGHKNPYMVVCFLACAKASRSYVPQDICIPVSRVEKDPEKLKQAYALGRAAMEKKMAALTAYLQN